MPKKTTKTTAPAATKNFLAVIPVHYDNVAPDALTYQLHADDFVVGLPGAMLESANGAVRLDFLADLDRLSPYPIRECAVQLRDNRNVDLEATLDRGRMDLVNRKQQGAAHVRVQVRKDIFDLTLAEPGARVAARSLASLRRSLADTSRRARRRVADCRSSRRTRASGTFPRRLRLRSRRRRAPRVLLPRWRALRRWSTRSGT